MRDFVLWFVQNFPPFLLSEPVSAFTGLFFLGYTIDITSRMMRLGR